MANGVSLYRLRKKIKKTGVICNRLALTNAWNAAPVGGMHLWTLDTDYLALPADVWNDILQHFGIGALSYKSERSDCDDFAFTVRGRVPLELKVNGVAAVLDFSGRHAYNALLVAENGGFRIGFVEPQGDTPDQWWIRQPGRDGMYDLDQGVVIF